MAFVGTLLQEVVKIKKNVRERKVIYDAHLQTNTLLKLLNKAKNTAFGKEYDFKEIISMRDPISAFQDRVPVYDYTKFHKDWLHRSLNDEEDIVWPGRIKYFALSSGTSGAPSKQIPVSIDMIQAMRQTSVRQMMSIYDLNLPSNFYQKQMLMVGGSADLERVGAHWEGDLSGILATQVPVWFYRFRKPSKKVAAIKNWDEKLDTMTKKAHKWDIGIVCGSPAWVQQLTERICDHYKIDTVREIWPDFKIFVHGGVAFGPYKDAVTKTMGDETIFMDTYLASEGFLSFEHPTSNKSMQLVLDKGIFFEFIPFNEENFTPEGEVKPNPEVLSAFEIKEGVDYAVLITTNAGNWRYLIGDTIKFTNAERFEMLITGRTKHFLSLCGEHLSVDNMTRGIEMTARELGMVVKEFTVAGVPYDGLFAHKWFIGTDKKVDDDRVKELLDRHLADLNDDYATERKYALKEMFVKTIPNEKFYEYLAGKGKIGGQVKFPRVLKKEQLEEWEGYLSS